MSKHVEEYIKNYTRNYSNVILIPLKLKDNKGCYTESYNPWLTPDQARKAVEIAREEVIEAAAEWMKLYVINHDAIDVFEMEKEFKKAMEEKV